MSNLNLSAILAIATVYGEKLYDFDNAESHGTTAEYALDGDSVKIPVGDGKFIYVPLTRATAENGIDESQPIEIVQVSALRDASGEFNGKPWSVAKGDVKLFARQ